MANPVLHAAHPVLGSVERSGPCELERMAGARDRQRAVPLEWRARFTVRKAEVVLRMG